MIEDRKDSVFEGKVSKTLLALMEGGKKAVGSGSKKAVALLALLLAISAMVGAEQRMATIIFGPEKNDSGHGFLWNEYLVDSTGDMIPDRKLVITKEQYSVNPVFDTLTKYYLAPGRRFMFEDEGMKPFQEIPVGRMTRIEINENMVGFDKMFALDIIKDYFPRLYAELVREGRAK